MSLENAQRARSSSHQLCVWSPRWGRGRWRCSQAGLPSRRHPCPRSRTGGLRARVSAEDRMQAGPAGSGLPQHGAPRPTLLHPATLPAQLTPGPRPAGSRSCPAWRSFQVSTSCITRSLSVGLGRLLRKLTDLPPMTPKSCFWVFMGRTQKTRSQTGKGFTMCTRYWVHECLLCTQRVACTCVDTGWGLGRTGQELGPTTVRGRSSRPCKRRVSGGSRRSEPRRRGGGPEPLHRREQIGRAHV